MYWNISVKWSILMKKSMKIIVPILLVILILASLFWYCFVYDRTFTRDILLSQARYHSTHGNPSLGSWFYDAAYEYSRQDENVAIELANQFKSEGNYTKAEYTLSNAIADGGTVELYMALCKTYVEQDKLLDAVNMLDNVADPAIKQQLDEMRPDAPTADPAPGFYSQYIPVTLYHSEGTLYYTTDGEYPSTENAPYSEPITLPAGETTIYAVSVADNGLVSPLTIMGFTVGGVIEQIYFDDPAIEQAVRTQLGREDDQPLYSNELWSILEFTVPAEAASCDDLIKLPYLEKLTASEYSFPSLRFLSNLTYVQELALHDCRFPIEDMEVIAGLPMLKRLTLSDCGLSTVAGLENAQNLSYLDLSSNTIRNLDPVSGLISLQELYLQHNAMTNLNALSSLSALNTLDVSYNSLQSIAPIATCLNLSRLDVSNNALTNLGAVDNLPEIAYLDASHNELNDVAVLESCSNLAEVNIANNALTDISALGKLSKLELLDFSHNEVTELPAWADDNLLRSINGSYNKLTSLSSLKNALELTHVYMDYNEITSVAVLENCYKLVMVNIYGNAIESVDMLTEHDIIVNYDPTTEED